MDVLAVEYGLREAALADVAGVLFSVLNEMEEPRPHCPACGNAMHSLGPRTKGVSSLLGDGALKRGYWECAPCHAHALPKDALLYVEGTSFTPGIRRIAARLASLESFEDASTDAWELCGVKVSAKEVERIAEEVGAGIEDANKQRMEAVFAGDADAEAILPGGAVIPRMYIECDGTGIPMTVRELKGRAGKQEDGTSKTREAKLGCIFTQSSTDDKGRPVRDEGSTTYFGSIECAEDFGKRMYAKATSRGAGHARQIVIIGDGAKWIWNQVDLHFPGAVQIVDMFHAKEHIALLAASLIPDGKPRALWIARCYALLEKGAVKALVKRFQSLPAANKEQQGKLDREVGYFSENAKRMQYAKFKKMDMFVGSGVIEAGCKNVIGKRLKQSGMHWSVRGANAIIALRCSIKSGTFNDDFESLLVA